MTSLSAWVRSIGNAGAIANAAEACRERQAAEARIDMALRRIGNPRSATRRPQRFAQGA